MCAIFFVLFDFSLCFCYLFLNCFVRYYAMRAVCFYCCRLHLLYIHQIACTKITYSPLFLRRLTTHFIILFHLHQFFEYLPSYHFCSSIVVICTHVAFAHLAQRCQLIGCQHLYNLNSTSNTREPKENVIDMRSNVVCSILWAFYTFQQNSILKISNQAASSRLSANKSDCLFSSWSRHNNEWLGGDFQCFFFSLQTAQI